MARRQFRSPTRTNRSRPNRAWAGLANAAPTTVAAATKVLLGTLTLSNQGIDETVLRTLGLLTIASDQAAANENQIGAWGMMVVTDLAIAAGAASIPGPITNIEDDGWFAHVSFANELQFSSAVGMRPNFGVTNRFDFKSKRVVSSGQAVAIMVENAHASNGFTIVQVIRMLTQVRGTG